MRTDAGRFRCWVSAVGGVPPGARGVVCGSRVLGLRRRAGLAGTRWRRPGRDGGCARLLEYARAAFPDDKIRICWDGASYHRAEDVLERAQELRILLTPLPAYSPDFMPVEALRRWMREEVTYNHRHAAAADLIAGVSVFEADVNQQPQVIFDRLNVRTKLDSALEKLRVT